MLQNIKANSINRIEKLVSEYYIWELYKSPYGKFKIKIFQELGKSEYYGYANMKIVNELGEFECISGYAFTEEEALKNTISNFFKKTSRKDIWKEEDFQCLENMDV